MSACAYIGALIAVAVDHSVHGPALASSPNGVAAGRLVPLLSSGIVDGPAWPQIALLAAALIAALRRLGAARLWTAAVSAHIGATLLAYAAIGVAWMLDQALVVRVMGAPDFGISVMLTGELGALVAAARNRAAVPAGVLVLALPGVAALAATGTVIRSPWPAPSTRSGSGSARSPRVPYTKVEHEDSPGGRCGRADGRLD